MELEAEAFDLLEAACRRQNLLADVRLKSRSRDRLLDISATRG
jgi:hypothetical protein